MLAHIGVDAGTGYIHSVTATGANVHDLDEIANLVRDDDEVVYTDAGYQGVTKRPDITGDEHRSKVEHPFLVIKRDFEFTKTRYRGLAKNLNHLHVAFACANWLILARAVALTG